MALYNVYCQAEGYLAIKKTIIVIGNSFHKYELHSGMWVGMWMGVAGLRISFYLFDSCILGLASSTISWKNAR